MECHQFQKSEEVHALLQIVRQTMVTFTKSTCTFTIVCALLQIVRALLQIVRALFQTFETNGTAYGRCWVRTLARTGLTRHKQCYVD